MVSTEVAVIGGGAVGTTVAGDLAERGADVTLFERDGIAAGSSGRAAGICYDAYADRRDVRIARRSIERFRALDVGFESRPYALLAREGDGAPGGGAGSDPNGGEAAAIRDLAGRMADRGVDVDLLAGTELGAAFPDLATGDVAVAAVARTAGLVDPTRYTEAMADRARAAGATIRTGVAAALDGPTTVRADGRTRGFDAVVVAAGPATKPLVAGAGVGIPLRAYRAQALVTDPVAADPPTVFDATGHYYLRAHGDGVLLGDGVETDVDPGDWDPTADEAFRERGREHLRTALGADVGVARSWAGLCTATPDRDPLAGELRDGLFVATGWHGHGLMRAPALGETLAAQVLGADGIAGFDPTRFDGDERFDVVEGMSLDER